MTQVSALRKALSWAISARFVVNFVNVAGMLFFARELGVKVIAEYGMAIVLVELLMLPINFGFNQAAIKFRGDQAIFSASVSLVTAQSAGLVLLFTVFCIGIKFVLGELPASTYYGAVILVGRIFTLFVTLNYAPLEGRMQYKQIAGSRVISTIVAVGCGVILALTTFKNAWVLVIRDVLSALLMLVLIQRHCPLKMRPTLNLENLRRVWRFTMPIWMLNMLDRLALRMDYAIVAYAFDQLSFGIYFQIRALVEGVLGFIVSPIQTVVYSYYCGIEERLKTFYLVTRKWSMAIMIVIVLAPVLLATTEVGSFLLSIVLGPDWTAGAALLPGLAMYAAGLILFEHCRSVAIATELQGAAMIARGLQVVLILALVYPASREFGLAGAGLVTGVAALSLAAVSTGILFYHFNSPKHAP